MIEYQYKPEQLLAGLKPNDIGLEYGSTRRYELGHKQSLTIEMENQECCVFVLKGKIRYAIENEKGEVGKKDLLYIPRNKRVDITAIEDAIIMAFNATAEFDTSFSVVRYQDIIKGSEKNHTFGNKENNTERQVINYLDDSFNACRLMVGICTGMKGGWTAWPPHEHAAQREEIYVYFDLNGGFGIQCVYEDMHNPLFVGMVTEGDLVSVPKGYHPSVGCPHNAISYIYVMIAKKSGKRSFMDLTIQPEFGNEFK